MKYCYCTAVISGSTPKVCDDCLVAHKIIVGCGQGLMPCGDTTTIDLNDYNKNPSDAVYSLYKYNTDAFGTVTISSAGVVSIETDAEDLSPSQSTLYEIEYMVVKGKYKTFGVLQVCIDDPCDAGCDKCNTCSGECYGTPDPGEEDADCGSIGNTFNAAAGLDLESCDGTNTWTAVFPEGLTGSISNVGLITYDVNNDVEFEEPYRITWEVSCSKYGMKATGYLDVTINDKCVGIVCDEGFECNQCDGECIEKESDLGVTGTGSSAVGSQSGGGITIS